MCSVRQSPMPCAPKRRAHWASCGVSAFARTFIVRAASAHSSNWLKLSSSAGSSMAAAPASTSPEVPSTVISSPSRKLRPPACRTRPRRSIASPEAPTMQGSPSPRAITAAWLDMPPRSVSTATEACIPRMSSGSVSRRTSTQDSSRAAAAWAAAAEKTMRPVAAPGLAAMPRVIRSRGARGSTWWCRRSVSARGWTRITACSGGMMPSRARPTAMRTAAREDRCTRIASMIDNRLSATTNSICISSFSRSRAATPNRTRSAKTPGAASSSEGPRASRVRKIDSASWRCARPCVWPRKRPVMRGSPVTLSMNWMVPEPVTPGPSASAMSCTTSPSGASAGAPLACRSSRAVGPSQARAMDRSTSTSCRSGSCGNSSSVSSL